MDLSVRDLIRLFRVSEKTVYRWIREKGLPAHKVQDQYRFNRFTLLEWAQKCGIPVRPAVLKDDDAMPDPSLIDALAEGGIYYDVFGRTKEAALDSITRLVKLPPSFSGDELKGLLLSREALASTGVGEGMAIPHVRDPIVLPITQPSLSICFLEYPIEFGAIDGKPVHTFFLLLSSTTRDHLKLLSRIAYLLHHQVLVEMLVRREKKEPLLEKIRSIEEGLKEISVGDQ